MELKQYLNVIIDFIKDYLIKSHCDKYVLGLSGGVDSSLVAALAKKAVGKDKLLTLILPIDSNDADAQDAIKVAKTLDINYQILDLSDVYHAFLDDYAKLGVEFDVSTKGNLKVRLRMCALYALAQRHKALVLGTDNAIERYVGYFTKYGDGGVDLLPIARLTKQEVREAAMMLGVPIELANRTPSAGLFEGQTDEGEMGVAYADLDAYILGKKIDNNAKARIDHLHMISEHKRIDIPMPEEFKRND